MRMAQIQRHLRQAASIRGHLQNWTDPAEDIPYQRELYGANPFRGRFDNRIRRLAWHESEAARLLEEGARAYVATKNRNGKVGASRMRAGVDGRGRYKRSPERLKAMRENARELARRNVGRKNGWNR